MGNDAKRETWRNVTKGLHGVLKHDRFGNEKHEQVRPGQTVQLTVEERMLNMDRAADEKLDVFRNGTFVPVRLIDDAEDAAEIASNPNLKGENDLKDMLSLHWKKFGSAVEEISNVGTLIRLREIATEEDATMRQFKVIENRILAVEPSHVFDNVDDVQTFGESKPGTSAVTPR